MRKPLDPDEVAKLIKASGVTNPMRLEFYQGAYYEGSSFRFDTTSGMHVEIHEGAYYEGASLRIEFAHAPPPPVKVTVDPPKKVAVKKPKKREPKTRRLKNPAIRKDGVILLKDRKPDPERPLT